MYGVLAKTNMGSNIERIIYPNGLESRYRYKCIYLGNADTAISRSVYALEDSYDTFEGKVFNHKTYKFDCDTQKSKNSVTITEHNEALDNTTISVYNNKGMLTDSTTSENGKSSGSASTSVSNSYNSVTGMLQSRTEKTNGISTETKYEFEDGYHNLLKSTVHGEKK